MKLSNHNENILLLVEGKFEEPEVGNALLSVAHWWHNKGPSAQSCTLHSSPTSSTSQGMTSSFLSSHGGGFYITRSQKLVQRGCTEAIKLIFGSKFGRTQKIVGKIS
jgi:hypothetical protein